MALVDLEPGRELNFFASHDIHERPVVIFLHGIMGRLRNLQGFVQRFAQEFPYYSVLMFDLRNHGESSKHWSPFTVEACATDIKLACERLAVKPTALIGHSFGGKVALMTAAHFSSIEQVWMLDCPPGRIPRADAPTNKRSLNTLEIIEILADLSWPMPSRKALVEALLSKGISNNIALWMTTNVMAENEGVRLIFDPSEMKEMLLDFVQLDCWPQVLALGKRLEIHLLAAEHGQRVTNNDQKTLAQLLPKTGHFHLLRNAGHFVHADNPQGLLDLMKPYFLKG